MPTDTYSTAGDFTWTCPDNVFTVTVQCWGAGSGGGRSPTIGNGGGGGAYATSDISVTPGVDYAVHVGAGGLGKLVNGSPSNGDHSWFLDTATVMARGASGITGGSSGSSVGTTKRAGGSGGAGNATIGGGGGSSAGTGSNGASGAPGASGGAGGTAPTGGGSGSNGTDATNATAATSPGGGGGASKTGNGGDGAAGKVVLTYTSVFPPVNTVLPAISGTAQVGQTLTTTDGTWTNSPSGYAYQWKSNGSNVGTNQNTYVPVTGDIGNTITVVVTATNGDGSTPATSNPTSAVLPAAPVAAFSGTPTSGAAPLSVAFTDASTNTPDEWLWEKNGGSGWFEFEGTPTAQNPTEEFAAGVWDVRLTATNAGGSDTHTEFDYVTSEWPAGGAPKPGRLRLGLGMGL